MDRSVLTKPKRVPRLSEHYEFLAEYYFTMGMEHSMWFYLMAAWAYEDEDAELAKPIYPKELNAQTIGTAGTDEHRAAAPEVQAEEIQ